MWTSWQTYIYVDGVHFDTFAPHPNTLDAQASAVWSYAAALHQIYLSKCIYICSVLIMHDDKQTHTHTHTISHVHFKNVTKFWGLTTKWMGIGLFTSRYYYDTFQGENLMYFWEAKSQSRNAHCDLVVTTHKVVVFARHFAWFYTYKPWIFTVAAR